MTDVNRQYKDRLFKFIFGNETNKEWTLSLYNAIHESHYDNPDDISFNTIEDAVYMGMKNDVSYIICFQMELWEHQSTFNPNMPMRFFIYSGRLYEKYIRNSDYFAYSSSLQKLPRPKCVCFYNGTQEQPEKQVLRLSDAYDGDGDIEVCVTMYNINYGKNKAMMEARKPLHEYAWLVDTVRDNQSRMDDLDAAVDAAIDAMPDSFMIKSFLMDNRSEVKNMFLTEYDQEKVLEQGKQEALNEGRKIGLKEGMQKGIKEGVQKGREEVQIEVATDMLKEGGQSVSFISRISRLPESAVRKLASQLNITVL